MSESASDQEPVIEDLEPGEPGKPTEPTEPTEPAEPQYLTSDKASELVSGQINDLRTWIGRRDKDLLSQIGSLIEEKTKREQPAEDVYAKFVENPTDVIREQVLAIQRQESSKIQSHNTDTMTQLASLMDSDPLFKDKELGNEVVAEIKKGVQGNKVDRSLSPYHAARVLLGDAVANVMRTRSGQKKSPLDGNNPGASTGNLKPGKTQTTKPQTPKLSEKTKLWASKWGYKEEDLAKLYAKES